MIPLDTEIQVKKGTIEIIPIGDISGDVLERVASIVKDKFGLKVGLDKAIPVPKSTFSPTRNQYDGSAILAALRDLQASKTGKLLGIIDEDIFATGLNYVFGQAILGGCCAIISLSRLRQGTEGAAGEELFLERVEKEAIHELGHAFGLRHCPNPRCVMYFSSNLADTDRKSVDFCQECGLPDQK